MLFPEGPETVSPGPGEVYPWQLYQRALFEFERVKEVAGYISDKQVVHWRIGLHDFFADVHGDAMVVEAGDGENVITRIEGDFLVMTNFPNGEFAGDSYKNVRGAGADRYRIAYETIADHIATFDVDRGLETLQNAVSSGEYATQTSMVFAPERGEVYIALKQDFDRIWRVSILDGTIETYAGFDNSRKMNLNQVGVSASSLAKTSPRVTWRHAILLGAIVVLAAGGTVLFIRMRRAHLGQDRDIAQVGK
jgi:hypothetical protein